MAGFAMAYVIIVGVTLLLGAYHLACWRASAERIHTGLDIKKEKCQKAGNRQQAELCGLDIKRPMPSL